MKFEILGGQESKLAGLMTMTEVVPRAAGPREELQGVWLQVPGSEGGDITAFVTDGHILASLQLDGHGVPTTAHGLRETLFVPNSHDALSKTAWLGGLKRMAKHDMTLEVEGAGLPGFVPVQIESQGNILRYVYPDKLEMPNWKRVIPQSVGAIRRRVSFNPSLIAPYFVARYGRDKEGHSLLLDASGDETMGMKWYDGLDDTLFGLLMPLRIEESNHPGMRVSKE